MATAKLEWMGGTDVNDAAQELIDAVAGGAEAAEGKFNDVLLRAVEGTTVAQIVAAYHEGLDAQAKAYAESPKGIAEKARQAAYQIELQKLADRLMAELPSLDFSNDVALLDWLHRLQDPSDYSGIRFDKEAVVKAFNDHGYVASANIGDDFNEDDRENYARYLVGQALSCLKSMGAIHQVFGTFHERWKAKFLSATR